MGIAESVDPDLDDVGAAIASARNAAGKREWPEAYRRWQRVQALSPGEVAAYAGAAQALREEAKYDDAELALARAVELFPTNEQLALQRASLANVRRDWPVAIERWEDVCTRFPANVWSYLGFVNALKGAGQPARISELLTRAEAALNSSASVAADQISGNRARLEIAKARSDWSSTRKAAEDILAAANAPEAQVLISLAQACLHLGDLTEADEAAKRALSIDERSTEAYLIRVQAATSTGDGETALLCYRALAQLNPRVVRWRLKLVQLLNWHGRVLEALDEIGVLDKAWPNDPMVSVFVRNYSSAGEAGPASPANTAAGDADYLKGEEIEELAKRAPSPDKWMRPLIDTDPRKDVLLAKVPGATTAVLVFTGTSDEVSVPLALFDRYLATVNASAIYLKDFQRLRYLNGIQSLGSDLPGTIKNLRGLIQDIGATTIYAMGNCVGGFGAIRYGVDLRVSRILAFSPPTHLPKQFPSALEEGRKFMKTRLEANIPAEMTDLRPFLQQSSFAGQIDLFYEVRNPVDQMQALHVTDCMGVRLHREESLSYRLLRHVMLRTEHFEHFLGELLN